MSAVAVALLALVFAMRPMIGHAQSSAGPGAPALPSGARIVRVAAAPSGVMVQAGDVATNARAVIAGVPVRALALNSLAESANARREINGPRAASLYVTTSDEPNRLLNLAGTMLSPIAGAGPRGTLGDGGEALAAQFDLKLDSLAERSGVAIASDGTIFIADTRNSTIRRIAGAASSEPGIIRGVAGRFAPAQNVALSEPLGLAVDRAGNLYIADRAANQVLVLRAATDAAPGALEILAHVISPASIAVTQDGGKVFVASPETGSVFAIGTASRSIHQLFGVAAESAASLRQGTSRQGGAPANAHAMIPAGLAVDRAGNLFVADAKQNQIVRVDAFTGKTTVAATNFNAPGDLAFDAKGNLYAADQGRSQVVMIANPSGVTCASSADTFVSICPAAAAFGNEPTGGTTSSQAFTVTNGSPTALSGLTIALSGADAGDFMNQGTTCLSSLASSATCTINAVFAPTVTGARSASLDVSDSNPQDSVSAALSGTGDDFQIQLAGSQSQSVTVTQGATATFNLQIAPDSIFSGAVTIVCPSNLPVSTTGVTTVLCKAPSSPVSVTPGKAAAFTVSFETTSTTGIIGGGSSPGMGFLFFAPGSGDSGRGPDRGAPLFPAAAAIVALAALGILLAARRRMAFARKRIVFAVASLSLLLGAAGVLNGCYKTPLNTNATPVGTTNFLIQGTSQNASRGLTVTMVVRAK